MNDLNGIHPLFEGFINVFDQGTYLLLALC